MGGADLFGDAAIESMDIIVFGVLAWLILGPDGDAVRVVAGS